jgi:hypothetical protein
MVAAILMFGVLAGFAQTGTYLFTGSMTTITLNPGIYNITTYGAQGGGTIGYSGGLGAEMEARFAFATPTTLTLLVGGAGTGGVYYQGGGGGGGSFFVNGTTPLVIAGGGGGSGPYTGPGASGVTQTSGGGGGGVLAGAGGSGGSGGNSSGDWDDSGGGGGGGGSVIDSSALNIFAEISGVSSPNDSPNGEIIITAVPEPTILTFAGLSGLCLLPFRRKWTSRSSNENLSS